jgi:hypothetical protein
MEDGEAEAPLAFHRASQNLAATTILLCIMPEPSTTEGGVCSGPASRELGLSALGARHRAPSGTLSL